MTRGSNSCVAAPGWLARVSVPCRKSKGIRPRRQLLGAPGKQAPRRQRQAKRTKRTGATLGAQ
eukprot:10654673-Alexandrium_andersonii.AAC.1